MRTALFVAHSFPPVGGSGSVRALKFARYLPSFAWRPVILSVDRARIGQPDLSLEAEIPPALPVYRARSLEPVSRRAAVEGTGSTASREAPRRSALRALKAALAHAGYFPDVHNSWLPDAVRVGMIAMRRHKVDIIYSSAVPFTNHVVALTLHLMTRVPLVLELRDGWQRWNRAIYPDYPAWRGVVEGALERFAFRHAARVILVTEQSAAAFRVQYSASAPEKFVVVPNGYDRRDYLGAVIEVDETATSDDGYFDILHLGSLYYGRSCADFLHAVGRLVLARPEARARLRVRLIGNLDESARAEIQAAVSSYRVSENVECLPFTAHAHALRQLPLADLLLLLVNTTPEGGTAVPGKLYEYLAARRPILCVAPYGSEAESIVQRAGAGVVVPAGDREGLESALNQLYEQWSAGSLRADHDLGEVARYHRVRLTGQLAAVFAEALEQATCCRGSHSRLNTLMKR